MKNPVQTPVFNGLLNCSISTFWEASIFVLSKESQHQIYNYLKTPNEYALMLDILATKKGKDDKVKFTFGAMFQNFGFSKYNHN